MKYLFANLENSAPLTKKLLPAFAVAISCWGCAGERQRDLPIDNDAGATEILTNLGVNEVSNPPAATYVSTLDTEETIDPASWQPLKTPSAVFSPRAEVLQIGAFMDNYWNTLIQDSPAYAHSVPFKDDQSWEKLAAKTSITADIDGDALAEAVVFYVKPTETGKLYYRVFKNNTVTDEKGVTGLELSGKSFEHGLTARNGLGTPWYPYLNSAKADLDGDGRSEILLVDYQTVHILSFQADKSLAVTASQPYSVPVSSVAAGDLDGDRKDEFVVGLVGASGAQYAIYDSTFSSNISNPEIQTLDPNGTLVEATFGDFNGTHLQQLALCTHLVSGPNVGKVQVNVFDFSAPPSSAMSLKKQMIVDAYGLGSKNDGIDDYFRMLPRAVDLTGLGKQQLHVLGWIFTDPMRSTNHEDVWSQLAPGAKDNTISDVQVGDVNNDHKQDLVYLTIGQDGVSPTLQVIGRDTNNLLNRKQMLLSNSAQFSPDKFGTTTTLAVGNFEDNAARVHYVGHKLTFTDPIVIAALASPPYWSNVAAADSAYQDAYTGWLTSFGTTTSTETAKDHSVGFSVGASLEYDHKVTTPIFGINIASFKASVEFTNTNTWQWSTSHSVETSVDYTCSGGQDCVIFTSVPLDQYEYQIDYSTDPANQIGKSLFINIPRTFSKYKVTREFFNANIGKDVIAPVDSLVFKHKAGDPMSYPTVEDKDALLTAYGSEFQTGPQSVSQGTDSMPNSGTANLAITVNDSDGETVSHDFSLVGKIGAGVGDWTLSVSAGFNAGYSATTTTSDGTQFGGTVGYLPTAFYSNPNYNYSSGVFAYPYKGVNGKSFWVVNYWVE